MFNLFNKNKIIIVLWFMISLYIVYFSFFTILRYRTLYASYFDLGIMHQTVYNTYRAIAKLDPGRILELTNPFGSNQITRMSIHNDLLLAPISLFYFIYSGPETLLVIQTIILAIGALAIYLISDKILKSKLLALIFSISYLLYPPMQRANIFEFHAVTLATTFLLFMFYFWLVKKYRWSFVFFILSILSKEQVALTTTMFGIYALRNLKFKIKNLKLNTDLLFSSFIIFISIFWFVFSMFVIIPYFRKGIHFALEYYADLKNITGYIFHIDTFRYFLFLLGPLAFLSILSPIQLLISLPEFAINLLSNSWNMRNIIYHYTAVITPFVFISAIYGIKKVITLRLPRPPMKDRSPRNDTVIILTGLIVIITSLIFSYFKGPLPYSREADIHPFLYPQKESKEVLFWKKILNDKKLKISSTGQLAPFFSSRRYYYTFSKDYKLADYIVLRLNEIYNYPEKEILIPIYEKLKNDKQFQLIYKNENLEVYKKVILLRSDITSELWKDK